MRHSGRSILNGTRVSSNSWCEEGMDSQFAERIDTLIRAAAVYSMAPDRAVYRSIASHDDRIVALSPTPDGVDGLILCETRVGGDSSLTALLAFIRTRCSLL
jgi:hypothetical protein